MHTRRNTLHTLWKELDAGVESCLSEQNTHHPFMQSFFRVIEKSNNEFAAFVRQRQNSFESSVIQTRKNPLSRSEIPAVTHRIWLTSPDFPSDPPAEYVTNYIKANLALPGEILHYFWTNSSVVAEFIRREATIAKCDNLIAMDTRLFANEPIMARIEHLISARKFVLAADILKFVILERFGGVYSDLGIVYDRQVFDLIQLSDYAFIVSNSIFFQSSFFACPPGSDLACIFLAIMNVPSAFDPRYALLGPAPTALDEVHIFAGFGLTVCAMLFMSPAARALMLPPQSDHMQWRSQESWYGVEGKFGNSLITETGPTLIGLNEFQQADELFATKVHLRGISALLRAQLRVLITLNGYFASRATHLCKNFYYSGSDKALHWHNYGYLYNFLFGGLIGSVHTILEIGIGTHNLDVPSTMGQTGVPGASLRAWKETFPLATVIGADIDIRILFQEPGIETYWVDQTSEDAVRQLFKNIGDRNFDLIIDDGLHTFPANRTLMDGAYSHLIESGMYIIEDIANQDLEAWKAYFAETSWNFAIVKLPHSTNSSDNCVILLPGGQTAPQSH